MTLFIEDSPRAHQAGWIADAVAAGLCSAAVVTPWATPWAQHSGPGKKPSATKRVTDLHGRNVDVWFDATTHALQMGGVGDFRYYDEYTLWAGPRGDVSTTANQQAHIRLVFETQDALGVPHLAPTILLHSGLSNTSTTALDLAREAIAQDPKCWLSIAGTPPFWASGSAVDAHIGALAALEPAGWFITVVRPTTAVPVAADPEEIHGLCRTVRALSEDSPVHVSHGDIAALPAVAAGASSVGSGWDKRQRVCSYTDYAPRSAGVGGGGWYQRPTLRVLLASLSNNEADFLATRHAAISARLGGFPPPGPQEAFMHHLTALDAVINPLTAETDPRLRYFALLALYDAASAEWPGVEGLVRCEFGAADWITRPRAGLALYGATEGW